MEGATTYQVAESMSQLLVQKANSILVSRGDRVESKTWEPTDDF